MERPRDPFDLVIGLRDDLTEVRTTVGHLSTEMTEVKQDIRRVDDRVFQVVLLQLATLTAALASIAASVLAALLS
jgi:hypothetical protein